MRGADGRSIPYGRPSVPVWILFFIDSNRGILELIITLICGQCVQCLAWPEAEVGRESMADILYRGIIPSTRS